MSQPPPITNNPIRERSQSTAMAHWTPVADDSAMVAVNASTDWAGSTTLAVRERSIMMMPQSNRPPQAISPEKELLRQEVQQMQYHLHHSEQNAMKQAMIHIQ